MPDVPVINICSCDEFLLWYIDEDGDPIQVCSCGHPSGEHIGGMGTCVGEVVVT